MDGIYISFSFFFAARAELIKGVVYNMLSYWVSSFKMPKSVTKELERMFSNFICNSKMHGWNWHDICRTKEEGEVGIRRISVLTWHLKSGLCRGSAQ